MFWIGSGGEAIPPPTAHSLPAVSTERLLERCVKRWRSSPFFSLRKQANSWMSCECFTMTSPSFGTRTPSLRAFVWGQGWCWMWLETTKDSTPKRSVNSWYEKGADLCPLPTFSTNLRLYNPKFCQVDSPSDPTLQHTLLRQSRE